MLRRLDQIEPLRTLPRSIAATDYNRVRLALCRLNNPLRIALEGLRCLEITLNDTHWLCVDACAQDCPVLAWTKFEAANRRGLHEPVYCVLHLYHYHAGLLMGDVMEALGHTLSQKLARISHRGSRMMAKNRGGWTPLWNETHSRSSVLSEE